MFDNSTNPIILAGPADPFCPRQINFTLAGSPGVNITATENGAGGIDFVVDVQDSKQSTGDLRALYFHMTDGKLGSASITGGDGLLTGYTIKANSVIDAGHGTT